MIIAVIGIVVMIQGGISGDSLFGNLTAFIAAVGFAGFTVSLRWGKNIKGQLANGSGVGVEPTPYQNTEASNNEDRQYCV